VLLLLLDHSTRVTSQPSGSCPPGNCQVVLFLPVQVENLVNTLPGAPLLFPRLLVAPHQPLHVRALIAPSIGSRHALAPRWLETRGPLQQYRPMAASIPSPSSFPYSLFYSPCLFWPSSGTHTSTLPFSILKPSVACTLNVLLKYLSTTFKPGLIQTPLCTGKML
jgi:hypothetical protein